MLVQNLFEPFQVEVKQSNECPIKTHKHTFFEMAYIVAGEGAHNINGNKFPYAAQNLFLLMPMDTHYFEVKSTSTFLLIRFNNIYLEAQKAKDIHSTLGDWTQKLEYIFQNSNPIQGCIVRNVDDRPLIKVLAEAIIREHANAQHLQNELMQHLINTMITLVARNITLHIAEKTGINHNASLDIIHYIHQHIYHPDKLKAETIAAHFNISLNYISEYFKKQTGKNLQQYIISYKLSLAEIRLRHSDLRLNEIAYELGFTDESHLTKTFKKNKGITPALYRKTGSDRMTR